MTSISSLEYGEGVRVSRQGGVEEIPTPELLYPDPHEIELQISEQQQVVIEAQTELAKELKEAELQAQLEAEARGLIESSKERHLRAMDAVTVADNEVNLAMEKEKHFEMQRAAAHDEVVRKEQERARAKAAQVLLAEEIKEAEKLRRLHEMNRIVAMNRAKAYEIAVKEAQLKIESIRLRSQLPLAKGELSQPSPLKIQVEVPARDLPEQRLFSGTSLSQLSTVAAAEIKESVPQTEVIEPEVSRVRTKKKRISSTKVSSAGSQTSEVAEKVQRTAEETKIAQKLPKERALKSETTEPIIGTKEAPGGETVPKKKSAIKKITDMLTQKQ